MVSDYVHWLISLNDFNQLWKNQPVFMLTQFLFMFGGICTLKHAISNGGRWSLSWVIILLNGTFLELISTSVPVSSYFWHSQAPIMLFGKRIPLAILFFHPFAYYTSIFSASLLRLSRLEESLAAGIIATVLNVPIEHFGVKYLQWTWHSSDPTFSERNYSVPWNVYNFHLLHTTIQCLLLRINENNGSSKDKQSSGSSMWKLFVSNLLLTIPMLCISFALFHHILHKFFAVHTQITFLMIFSSAVVFVWHACSTRQEYPRTSVMTDISSNKYIKLPLLLSGVFYLITPFLSDPEKVIATGPRQAIGPCDVTELVPTLFGKFSERRKYLCWKSHEPSYFDFHCLPEFAPSSSEILSQYTICGTPFENKIEFVCIMIGTMIVTFYIFKTIFDISHSHRVNKNKKM